MTDNTGLFQSEAWNMALKFILMTDMGAGVATQTDFPCL